MKLFLFRWCEGEKSEMELELSVTSISKELWCRFSFYSFALLHLYQKKYYSASANFEVYDRMEAKITLNAG